VGHAPGHAPPPEEIAMGCARPLWGKFWEGGLQIGGWADEEDKTGAEPPNVEGAWEIAACWLKPEFIPDIIVADMAATSVVAAELVATEFFAKGATEDTGALGACMGTIRAKSGHLFKYDRTASRFSSLFADFGDYDDFATLGVTPLDKFGLGPHLMTPVLDTG